MHTSSQKDSQTEPTKMTRGIDVSQYQGAINWAKVKESGISTVIVRCGWGQNNIDKRAAENIQGAINAGLSVGVYWFIYGLDEAGIANNALKFYEVVKPFTEHITAGYWCDWEGDTDAYANKNGVKFTKAQRTDLIKVFCGVLTSHGLDKVGVYLNPDYLRTKVNDLSEFPLWLACYSAKKPTSWPCVMWQYSSKGTIDGIEGNVDLNEVYFDAPTPEPVPTPERTISGMPILRKGSRGKAVQIWQIIVDAQPDGIFGDITQQRTIHFQTVHGIQIDGIVGNESWNTGINSI